MAFTWNEQTISVTKEYIAEVRNNIDSIDSNIACLTNKVTYYNGHLSVNLGTKYATNNTTQNVTDKTSHNYSYDSSDRSSHRGSHDGSYDGSYDGGYRSSNYGTQVISDYNSYDSTHRAKVFVVD